MWTLVIIVLTNGAGASSGAGAAIAQMVFASEDQCNTAASQLSTAGTVNSDKGGPYQIIAKCIARSSGMGGIPAPKK
jgi:hypothetical protein